VPEGGGVSDQALEYNPFAPNEEKAGEEMIPTATLQIYRAVEQELAREESTHVNRASAANMCVRRRWYQRMGHRGTPLTPRKILNFAAGDIGEHVVKYFILKGCVGPGKLYSEVDFGKQVGTFTIQHKEIPIFEQQTLRAVIGGIEVTAHGDGWGKRNADGKWEYIECKTAADFGFDRFVAEGPGDYVNQAHAVMMTDLAESRGVRETRFFFMKKSTGHIWDRLERWDDRIAGEVALGYQLSNREEIPNRPYGAVEETYRRKPTGRQVLPWQCGYCPFTETCWPGVEKQFKNGKPVFVMPSGAKGDLGETQGEENEPVRETETA
jgi:hypothetical protein